MDEARALASFVLFRMAEDFRCFLFNPAFSRARFSPAFVSWHYYWLWGASTGCGLGLMVCTVCGGLAVTVLRRGVKA